MNSDMKRNFALLSGPLAFLLLRFAAQSFGSAAASALGMAAWMALWWVFRPVGIAVTALLPIAVNAVLNLIPSGHVISNYFSEIVVLLLGADLICLTWSRTGLDRRVAVKALCGIGTSMRQQIVAWLGASVVLSVFLPNVVVAAILCPIAAAMLKFVNGGEEPDVRQSAPILLAIGWGSGIGGFGSPIGGAANLVAIAYMEQLTGHEFMYVDWVLRFVPILFLVFLLNLFFLWQVNRTTQDLNGGPLKRGEKIGLTLFVLATMLAFLRPLYAEVLPGLKPAYSFLTLGLLMFVLRDENDEVMMDWKYAESHVMWGMMFLFASGMALGRMLIETGAVKQLTALIASSGPSGGLCSVWLFSYGTVQQYGSRFYRAAGRHQHYPGYRTEPGALYVTYSSGGELCICSAGFYPRDSGILRTGRRASNPQGPAADHSQCTPGNGFGLVLHKLCTIFLKVLKLLYGGFQFCRVNDSTAVER